MPIYEFECTACGNIFDRLQKLSDPDPQDCASCGAGPIRRRVTAPSFRLSGSGWYETDFKKDGDKKRNLTESESAAAKPDAKADSKADAKPDAKATEAKPATDAKPAPASTPPKSVPPTGATGG